MDKFKEAFCCCCITSKVAPAPSHRMNSVKQLMGKSNRELTAIEDQNPVLAAIALRIESGEQDVDFKTAPDLVDELLDGAAKELQYPHTFNGNDTLKLLHRLLRVVLESLNDLVMCGFADNMTPQEQTKVLGKMHYRCHNWVEERLDRFELSELAGKVSPSDRINWKAIPRVQHELARSYHEVGWMFFVEHTQYLRRETFDIPVECVGEKERLRVLFLLPPVDSGCPLQFSMQVLETLEDTHGNLQFSCQELTNKKDLIASIAGFQPHVIHFAGDSDTGRLVMPDGAALAMPPFGWRA